MISRKDFFKMNVKKLCRLCIRVPKSLLDALPEKCNSDKMNIDDLLLDDTCLALTNDTVWEIYLDNYKFKKHKKKQSEEKPENKEKREKNQTISVTFRVTEDVNFEINRLATENNMKITKFILLLLVLKTYSSDERKALTRKMEINKKAKKSY